MDGGIFRYCCQINDLILLKRSGWFLSHDVAPDRDLLQHLLSEDSPMTTSDAKRTIAVNGAFWLVAMLVHPVLGMLPSSTGHPPKIFELLVPLFFIILAGGSTFLLKTAIGKTTNN